MESTVGLIIQFAGIFLLMFLSFFLHRSLKTSASILWAIGWGSLAFALLAAVCAFIYRDFSVPLLCLYFAGEYVFCLLLIEGCRALAPDYKPNLQRRLAFFAAGLPVIFLTIWTADFRLAFHLHALVMSCFFAAGFRTLAGLEISDFGRRVMSAALAFLTLNFFSYFVIHSLVILNVSLPLPKNYPALNPVFDLVLEIMLGFGMVIVLLERVLSETRRVNEELQAALAKLEQTAHTDSLTTALNRHAFYGFVSQSGAEQTKVSGCVGFFDIDDLKPINDQYGHAVGDMVIRAVVSAIRNLIRAEDLIYRWGGDEFFVLLVSMDEQMARARMRKLDRLLSNLRFGKAAGNLTVYVSYGFRDFSDIAGLDEAIKAADEEMYRFKHERKEKRKLSVQTAFAPNENAASFHQRADII